MITVLPPLYSLVLVVAAVLTGLLAAYAWHHRALGDATCYAALLFGAMTLHAAGYAFELTAPALETGLAWIRVEYLGIAVIAPLVLGMILSNAGYGHLLTRRALAGLFVVPVVTLVLVFLMHPLYYTTTAFDTTGPFPLVVFDVGPWYIVHSLNLLLSVLVGIGVLLVALQRATHVLIRRQILMMLLGSIFPVVAFIVYLVVPMNPKIDVIPFFYPLTAIFFTIGMARFQLFGLGPVGYATVVERVPIGVLVLNNRGQVIDANPAARDLLGEEVTAIGTTLDRVATRLPALPALVAAADGTETEVPDGDNHLVVSAVALADRPDRVGGSVVLVRDVSARRQAEEELARRTADLEAANQRLSLLSAVTRHDIANQLVVIDGRLALLAEETGNGAAHEEVEGLVTAVGRVRAMVEFMRDYPMIGAEAPTWLDLNDTASRAVRSVALGGITVENRLPSVAVFADPLLERVFATLVENAVRHGGPVTHIQLDVKDALDGIVVTVEDDGCGVPMTEKARIFEQGVGRNTGLGLFLASEILASMGITIKETGVPKEGARFELQIPAGRLQHE